MNQKTCTYCNQEFRPSHYHPDQQICSSVDCQRQRRSDYHRRKISIDPGYRDQCRDSQKKWRQNNPGYMSRYVAERKSRERSAPERARLLSELRRLETLVKNNVALDLSSSGTMIWLITARDFITKKNTLANAQVIVLEGVLHAIGPEAI